ncbi:glycosyltransferase [uncultured Maribacter sp.]|uniref:glycosyltransferase n=1 Tax=uncultured Maribacter sp. TaxID=431308 RepID=UPI0030DA7BD7|tara:strand:- start:10129 stop:11229 length:1101 start_codon:yes stop_codon:yes gene_type:complete
MRKKIIVISGININQAGPLSVMKDLMTVFSENKDDNTQIIALVNNKKLYDYKNVKYLEFPKSKKSWFLRIYYEYFYFKKLSKRLKADLWISMHDMTPNVECDNLYVYCHNATPYYSPTWKDWIFGSRASLFSYFYSFLYSINIKKNKGVIVQQDWFRKKLIEKFKLKNVIVAYPDINIDVNNIGSKLSETNVKKIFYPSYPRSFKNFEVICEAYKQLLHKEQEKLEIFLTMDKNQNAYASYIFKKYGKFPNIHFIGLQTREKVFEYYRNVDALIFPSKLESWGLPITEFKIFGKPIILSDLPYARETLGTYDYGYFFNPEKAEDLAQIFRLLVKNELEVKKVEKIKVDQPFVEGWKELYDYLLEND